MTPRRLLLVFAGGTAGTAARLAIGLLLPDDGGVPVAVLVANVLGALLIGILTARPFGTLSDLARIDLRLLLGTGALGGFTTYSALATGTLELWAGAPLLAAGYAVGSVALGLAAAAVGLRLGRPRAGRAA